MEAARRGGWVGRKGLLILLNTQRADTLLPSPCLTQQELRLSKNLQRVPMLPWQNGFSNVSEHN